MSEDNKLRAVWRWNSTAKKWDRIRMSEAKVGDWISAEVEPGSLERMTGRVEQEPRLDPFTGRWECYILGYPETASDVPAGSVNAITPPV